jgi:hypothetical protein
MKTGLSSRFILLGVLALICLSSGCYSNYKNRVNQQLWEREMRMEEDCIYRLRWELEDKQRELDAANARMDSLNKQTDILRGNSSSGPDLGPPPAFNSSGSGRSGSGGEAPRLPPAPAPSGLPEIQQGKPFTPGASSTRGSNFSVADTAPAEPEMADPVVQQASYETQQTGSSTQQASYNKPDESAARPVERLNPDTEIESIELNEGLTGEINSAGKAGAGYLNIVLQQRDSHGKRVLAPGDVSIVVVDPALEGPAARIARWDFDSDDVPQHVRRNHDGASLQFQLPWPTPPQHSDLRVFARFTSYDGRRLEANLPIDVQVGAADVGPRDWKKSNGSSAVNAGRATDAFADADNNRSDMQRATHQPGSVYQADEIDSGPALTGTPLANQSPSSLASASAPLSSAPPANSSAANLSSTSTSASASNDKPLLDASRRPVWSPYR